MKIALIIPARYQSSRFVGKPLAKLTQPDGSQKTLIELTWDAAIQSSITPHVFVATDDDRIKDHVESFGGNVIMTSPDCKNGTERCADAINKLDLDVDVVVNLQGDAPLTPTWFLQELVRSMEADAKIQVATPVLRCDEETLRNFQNDRKAGRVGGTTAALNRAKNALYFSKEVIPYVGNAPISGKIPVFHHVGVYAYRVEALRSYGELEEGELETYEGLEQLRFLENQVPVKCVEVDAKGQIFWELNNPEDVERIEKAMRGNLKS